MADQEAIPIGLETQNKVAEAIYLRWYSNGPAIHAHGTRCPWRARSHGDAWPRTPSARSSPLPSSRRCSTTLYDEGYDAAGKDAQGGNEGEEPR